MKPLKYWMGDTPKCEFAGDHLDNILDGHSHELNGVFYDAKVVVGPWAMMCERCFSTMAIGLGMGRGQKYERQPDGKWLKTGG